MESEALKNIGFEGKFSHVAIVVKDIEQAMQTYCQLLQIEKPFCKLTGDPESAKVLFKGQSTPARSHQSFVNLGGLRVELMQPDEFPSTWRETLDVMGNNFHHAAYEVEDIDKTAALFARCGMPVIQTGSYRGGKYAYIDSRELIGMMVELLQSV